MVIIKKIKALSLAKVLSLFYAVIGFLMAIVLFIPFLVEAIAKSNFLGFFYALFNSVVVGLITAVAVGVFGFIQGFLMALVYNWSTKKIGGLVVVFALEEEEKKKQLRQRWTAKAEDDIKEEKKSSTKKRTKSKKNIKI